ncbi:hypothetical protein FACS1894185_3370 [Betaproteobacteria bacterium]|nr:hypothetical protein FACS1894185_3370 [Betaproteobacteria bacterium]
MSKRSKKQIAAAQKRSLEAIAQNLDAMGEQWFDVDEYNVDVLADLANLCREAGDVLHVKEAAS